MDHQLENLGPDRFQQLVQALLVAEFPNVTCFPIAQPDGGRDALLPILEDDNLQKFAIYQVKYSRNPSSIEDIKRWMLEKAEGEVEKVRELERRGATNTASITV